MFSIWALLQSYECYLHWSIIMDNPMITHLKKNLVIVLKNMYTTAPRTISASLYFWLFLQEKSINRFLCGHGRQTLCSLSLTPVYFLWKHHETKPKRCYEHRWITLAKNCRGQRWCSSSSVSGQDKGLMDKNWVSSEHNMTGSRNE